ncbi:hypothetical protein [Crystallibacter degradans]|uniref:hypothetical protein n=1 Tax=Crystallibacter degradans TaxID=2726743 RepID=UPI0014747225|nr:hypothetical protein [Arthrobacter sp. SF27]NMR31969.1 hypothetical protein [Arthrobacter sp. SF27]
MTDIPLYRLRAFEASFIEPHMLFLEEYPQARDDALELLALHLMAGDQFVRGASHGLLRMCLLVESEAWLEAGRRAGYFPYAAGTPEIVIGEVPLDKLAARLGYYTGPLQEAFSSADPNRLATQLALEAEGLTPSRLEYLRLLIFAENDEQRKRIEQAEQVAALFVRRPDITMPTDAMDEISWVLHGPDDEIYEEDDPSLMEWPSRWRREQSWHERQWAENAQNLRDRVKRCRQQFEAAIAQVALDERRAGELQNRDVNAAAETVGYSEAAAVDADILYWDQEDGIGNE